MSVEAIAWAWAQQTGSATHKAVLLTLANYADEHGFCWPSQELIARRAECSVRTVRTVLKDLEAKGVLQRSERRRPDGSFSSNAFQLCMGGRTSAAPPPAENSQRQDLPEARFAGGKIPSQPAARFAGQEEPIIANHQTAAADAGARGRARPADHVVDVVDHPFLDPHKSLGLVTSAAEVQRWLDDGADLDLDVIPTVKALCAMRLRAPAKSWGYFRDAVREAASRRLAPPDPIQPAVVAPGRVVTLPARRDERPRRTSITEAALAFLEEHS